MARFVDVFSDETKRGYKVQTSEYLPSGKYPIIDQGQAQIVGYTNLENGLFIDVPAIIFGDHTRVVKYVDRPFFLGADGVKVLKSKVNDADYKYLFYCLQNAKIPNTGYNRHFKWLKEVDIPLPPLDEQRRIAAVLDKVTGLIAKRRQQLEMLDEMVKARFVEMFGDPVSNPHKWQKVALSDVAAVHIGPFGSLLHKDDYITGGHPLVNPSHILDGKIIIDEKLTVSKEKYDELEPYHLKVGDVIMARRGEMGRCAVVQREGLICGTGSLLIRTKGSIMAEYIQKILSFPTFKKTIEDLAVGQTMQNLNVSIVSNFQIINPPLQMQKDYYSYLTQTETTKTTIIHSLGKLETLKKSLMQEYFR